MIRRTNWHHYWPNAPQLAEQVAGWMAEAQGWSAVRTGSELAAYHAICSTDRACCARSDRELPQ
jgi:hypothetical protein